MSLLAILTAVFFLIVRNGKEARTALGRLHGAKAGPSGYENRSRLRTPRVVDREDAPLPVIAGNIYSTDGRPIAGATVAAATFEIAGNIATKASAVESDEDGHFTLSVPEGTYQINARKEGYGPAATMSHSGSTVSLLMPKSGVVKGHVYDEHRLPVRYFTIEVVSEGANDMPAAPPLWSRRFDSPDGSFAVEELPTWEVLIRATASDYAPALSAQISAAPGETREVELVMASGCTLTGKVEDKAGKPLSGVIVDAESRIIDGAMSDPTVDAAEHVESDREGNFRLDHVPNGDIVVRAYAGKSAVTSVPLQISDCSKVAPVKVVVSAGGSLAGVARRGDGAPLPGARLSLMSRSVGIINTLSDAEGRYRFDEVAPDAMRLELHHEGQTTLRFVGVTEGEVTEQDISLSGEGTGEIRGRVTAGGRPLAGIRLLIAANHGRRQGIGEYHAVTGADGEYRVTSVAEGTYVLTPLSAMTAKSLRIKGGDVAVINLDVGQKTASAR